MFKNKIFDGKVGQITVFIILGIILLAIGSLFIFFKSDHVESTTDDFVFTDTSSVNIFVEGCLSSVAEDGIFYIGENGGYYSIGGLENYFIYNFYDIENITVPIYYDQSEESYLPSIGEIEYQLDLYIQDNLNDCLEVGFETFATQGWEVSKGELKVESTIRGGDILVELDYPLDIIISDNVVNLQKFEETLDLDFMEIYSIVEETLEYQKENPNYIIVGNVGDLARLNDFSYEIDYVGDDLVMYVLYFDNDLRVSESYIWGFAVQYDWEGVFEE